MLRDSQILKLILLNWFLRKIA